MRKIPFVLLLSICTLVMASCGGANADEYRSSLDGVIEDMIGTASKAESMLNDYANVWSHTIESRGAIPVSEMASVTGLKSEVIEEHFIINSMGHIPDDFSVNIYSLNDYFESTGDLDEIKNSRNNIKERVSDLNDPPDEYSKVYDEILDMYNIFMEYTDMALDPSGSLKDFNANRSELSNKFINKHNRIEVMLPGNE